MVCSLHRGNMGNKRWLCPMHTQNSLPSFDVLPSYKTCQLLSSKDPQQVPSQKAAHCSTYIWGPTSTALVPYSSSLYCIAGQLQNSCLSLEIGNLNHHHTPSCTSNATSSCSQCKVSKKVGSDLYFCYMRGIGT